jgi:hypothetical protein
VRNGAIYILDYKPDARTNKPIAQLTIYALALSHLTGIKLFDIKCAWFNEYEYCEFFPRALLSRHIENHGAPTDRGTASSKRATIAHAYQRNQVGSGTPASPK